MSVRERHIYRDGEWDTKRQIDRGTQRQRERQKCREGEKENECVCEREFDDGKKSGR